MPLSAPIRKHLLGFGKQKEIARRIGVSEGYVSNVINGLATPRTPKGWRTYRRVQVAIARALNLPLAEVFGETEASRADADHASSPAA